MKTSLILQTMYRNYSPIKYFLIALLIFTGANSYAQNFNIALKLGGGLAYQHVDNDDILSVNTVSSFSFGGMVGYNLPKNFELQSGLNLARKGAIITEDAITTTKRVTTVDLPLSLVKKISAQGLGTVYFGGGGYFSSAIGGNAYYETPSSSTSDKLDFGPDDDLRRFDAGLNFTAGLKLNNRVLFDLTYQLGLKNLASTRLTDTGTSQVESRMFTASLGYTFR